MDELKKRKFLGHTFHGRSKLRIAPKSIERLKARVRELTRRKVSINVEDRLAMLSRYLTGWMSYFRLTEAPSVLRDLDKWIRHRVRVCIWSTWKLPRTRMRKLEALGARRDEAGKMTSMSLYYAFELLETKMGNWTLPKCKSPLGTCAERQVETALTFVEFPDRCSLHDGRKKR